MSSTTTTTMYRLHLNLKDEKDEKLRLFRQFAPSPSVCKFFGQINAKSAQIAQSIGVVETALLQPKQPMNLCSRDDYCTTSDSDYSFQATGKTPKSIKKKINNKKTKTKGLTAPSRRRYNLRSSKVINTTSAETPSAV